MLKTSISKIATIWLLLTTLFLANGWATYYEGDDLGYVDTVYVDEREFSDFNGQEIIFYRDDLQKGYIEIHGLLSPEEGHDLENLRVEISMDGGDTWVKTTGSEHWNFRFTPQLQQSYELSLRVVEISIPNTLPDTQLRMGGFVLALADGTEVIDGVLNGEGYLTIPYLSTISESTNTLSVQLHNLQVRDNIVEVGEILYGEAITIATDVADIEISNLTISAIPQENHLEGQIHFKGVLSSMESIALPQSTHLLAERFETSFSFEGEKLAIWSEKDVNLLLGEGSLAISYQLGAPQPEIALDLPAAQFELGTLLTDASGTLNSVVVDLTSVQTQIETTIDQELYLLGSGIRIPSGLELALDLSDLNDPKLSFSTSVDFSEYDNVLLQQLEDSEIEVAVSRRGFNAQVTSSGRLAPVTIIDRGDTLSDVRLLFSGDAPSFSITIANSDLTPKIKLSSFSAEIDFGDLLQSAQSDGMGAITPVVVALEDLSGELQHYTLNLAQDAYLMGSGLKLPAGMQIALDLEKLQDPKISFSSSIDLSSYSDPIVSSMREATIAATLSKEGFEARVSTSADMTPIILLDRGGVGKDVRIVFDEGLTPSFTLSASATSYETRLDLDTLHANVDFGDLLTTVQQTGEGVSERVMATLALGSDSAADVALNFTGFSKVKLLDSDLLLSGVNANFNLDTKMIEIDSSVDLDGYDNPILQALSGSTMALSVSPRGITGALEVQDALEPIVILDRGEDGQDVKLTINGTPSVAVSIDTEGVGFDFGTLDASLSFGDLLQQTQGEVAGAFTPVVATLQRAAEVGNGYIFRLDSKVYLLGSDVALENTQANFDLDTKQISFTSTAALSSYDNPIVKAFDGGQLRSSISPSGFDATLSKEGALEPIVILDRGGISKDIALTFSEMPAVSLRIVRNRLDFDIDGGEAELDFGDLLEGSKATLVALGSETKEQLSGHYSWSISGSKKLLSAAQAHVSQLQGMLDLSDVEDPIITLNGDIDLRPYGGIFSSSDATKLIDAQISKEGFSAGLSIALGSVDIYKEEAVKLIFTKAPRIDLAITQHDLSMHFSKLSADLDFGTLLDGGVAHIGSIGTTLDTLESSLSQVKKTTEEAAEGYSWYLSGSHTIGGSEILLSDLSGSLDLDDLSNPSIILNANADMRNYGALFKYIRSAGVENAKISKSGFEGTLITEIQDIDIWKDKNVKLHFSDKKPPKFSLKVTTSGVRVGIEHMDATVAFGSLLDGAVAQIKDVESGLYHWELSGQHALGDTKIALSNLSGGVDLSDLRDPLLELNATANLTEYGALFSKLKTVSLTKAQISKRGFSGALSATLDDINIWKEKEVSLHFIDAKAPTLHLSMLRNAFSIGITDLNAELDFGQLLDGERVTLAPLVTEATEIQEEINNEISVSSDNGIYTWRLKNEHTLLHDDDGNVTVSEINGVVNLHNLHDPIIVFGATADFSQYHFDTGHIEVATLEDAKISRAGIDWNLVISGAGTEVTILDLGSKDEDVRLELANIGGSISNSSAHITQADGILYFGALFDGDVEPITLSYEESGRYSFTTDQVFSYKNGSDSILLSGLSGEVLRVGSSYKVTLSGDSEIRATLLQQIGLGTISIDTLEVGSSGLKGNITSTWNPRKVITLVNAKASLELSEVGVHIDSTQEQPISLIAFSGDIDVSPLFDEGAAAAKASLLYSNDALSWNFSRTLHINKFEFKDLGGQISLGSLDDLSIGLNGHFSYSELETLSLDLEQFFITNSGLSGTVAMGENSQLTLGTPKLQLTAFSTTFGDSISGTAVATFKDPNFLTPGNNLDIEIGATIDTQGIREFSIESDSLSQITIDNFAQFSFSHVSASPSLQHFWINLDGTVKPDYTLFKASNGLEFQDLNISEHGISIASAGTEFDVSGANATLGGLDLSLEKVGIGFEDQLFYVTAKGGLSLMGIEAGAGVKLYSDSHLKVDSINVLVNKPGLSLGGEIAWYEDDEIYGNGFGATGLQLRIADIFSVKGAFQVGKVNNYLYWRGQAQGGLGAAGIPMGPLSIYELGGGVAHNMAFENHDFVPRNHNDMLILATLLGTQDMGFMWHGQLDLQLNSSGQINLYGTTYILSKIGNESDDRKITADIEMGFDPATVHIAVDANIKYEVIGVEGKSDIMLSPSEKHLYVGTDHEFVTGFNVAEDLGHVKVAAFGFNANGYFMVDTRQLAFGLGYKLDETWEKDWVGCNPKLAVDLEARADALVRYNPLFMKIGASADAELEGCYCACIDIDAHVLMELGAPDPNYLYAKASVSIDPPGPGSVSTTLSGYVYGSGRHRANDDQPKLLDHIEPYADSGLSIMPEFKILTMSNEGATVNIKEIYLKDAETQERITLIEARRQVSRYQHEPVYLPSSALQPEHSYTIAGELEVRVGRVSVSEGFEKNYRTINQEQMNFDDLITEITPENGRDDVFELEPVLIQYDDVFIDVLGVDNALITNFKVEILNSKNTPIEGHFSFGEYNGHKASQFIPSSAMRIYYYCVNGSGEIRETFLDNEGHYRNPFKGYRVDGSVSTEDITPPTLDTQTNGVDIDLGAFVSSYEDSESRETFSYFMNNTYKIVVTDQQMQQIVYYSSFKVSSNASTTSGVREIEHLQDMIRPALILHRDEDTTREIRVEMDSGLYDAGIRGGVRYHINTIWRVEKDDGSTERLEVPFSSRDLAQSGYREIHFDGEYIELIPGSITYVEAEHPEHTFFTKRFDFRNGEGYSSVEEEERAAAIEQAQRDASGPSDGGLLGGTWSGPNGPSFGSPGDTPDGVPGRDEAGGGWQATDMIGAQQSMGGAMQIGSQSPASQSMGGSSSFIPSAGAAGAAHAGSQFNLGL